MEVIIGFGIIMAFLAAGECLSVLMGHFVPGSVVGMMLLLDAKLALYVICLIPLTV